MLSSVEHLEKYIEIVENTNLFRKYILGNYEIPYGFPFMKAYRSSMKFPLVMFTEGILRIGRELNFDSKRLNMLVYYHNINSNYSFSIGKADIKKVERYKFISPIKKNAPYNWIKLITTQKPILIYSGKGGLFHKKVAEHTELIYEDILRYIES